MRMTLLNVKLEDIGYREIGPRPGEPPLRSNFLSTAAANSGYDTQQRGGEVLIRRKERKKGTQPTDLLTKVADFTEATWKASGKTLGFLDSWKAGEFGKKHNER